MNKRRLTGRSGHRGRREALHGTVAAFLPRFAKTDQTGEAGLQAELGQHERAKQPGDDPVSGGAVHRAGREKINRETGVSRLLVKGEGRPIQKRSVGVRDMKSSM